VWPPDVLKRAITHNRAAASAGGILDHRQPMAPPDLYNREGLPASPFRTDSWEELPARQGE